MQSSERTSDAQEAKFLKEDGVFRRLRTPYLQTRRTGASSNVLAAIGAMTVLVMQHPRPVKA